MEIPAANTPTPSDRDILRDVDQPASLTCAVAAFRFWRPAGPGISRGILVLVPGANGDGRAMVMEPVWQDYARRQQLALVGCYFKDHLHANMNVEEYCRAGAGSGAALLTALQQFADQAQRPEVATAPLLFWGHSAGGQFNYEFACWQPERVLAFVVNKGGYYYTHLAPAATRQVPGIFFIGANDAEFRVASIRGIFAVNQSAGAGWKLVIEPNTGHEEGESREQALRFFDGVITARFAQANGSGQPSSLVEQF